MAVVRASPSKSTFNGIFMTFQAPPCVLVVCLGTTTVAGRGLRLTLSIIRLGTTCKRFNTLPDPGATSGNPAEGLAHQRDHLHAAFGDGSWTARDDPTIRSPGNSIGGPTMAGWEPATCCGVPLWGAS